MKTNETESKIIQALRHASKLSASNSHLPNSYKLKNVFVFVNRGVDMVEGLA